MSQRALTALDHADGGSSAARKVERACLWLLAASGAVVLIEPAPYEFLFPVALLLFLGTGIRLPSTLSPLIICLALFAAGGLFALPQAPLTQKNVTFVAVSIYLMATALFFAIVLSEQAAERLDALRSGYIAGAVFASLAAILGVLDVAGLGGIFSLYGRAAGTFKDPNVLGAFLVPAACFLLQDLILGRGRSLVLMPAGILILAATFLSFSRGAWVNLAVSAMLIVLLSYVFAPKQKQRLRALAITLAGLVAVVVLIAIALSVDQIREIFELRARLDQSYDLGETGRFGRQLNSLPVLLDSFWGLGPFQFGIRFGEDPHNVYLNAFSAYGWLGGLAYLGMTIVTLIIGVGLLLSRSSLRHHCIAIFAPLLVVFLQGLQIDTDHWRHVFLLIGALWGLHAALLRERTVLTRYRAATS